MDIENYRQIEILERDNWWYRSRRDLLDKKLASYKRRFKSALDAGCGVGSNLEVLKKYCEQVYGIDNSELSLKICQDKGYKRVYDGDILDARFEDSFELIICMDVLEHIVEDSQALGNLSQRLEEGGTMIISVPAHQFLWNDNDTFSQHKKRYELKDVEELVSSNGLEIERISYWNQIMFIPSLIFYNLRRSKKERKLQNNLNLIPQFLNEILFTIMKIENGIFLRHGLIEGVSIICIRANDSIPGKPVVF
jgi:SAM-dependent methyltransferase